MSKKELTTIKYEDISYKKVYTAPYTLIKPKKTPFKIVKTINKMKSHIDKIYNNFYLSATDMKRQREIEEYNRFKKMQRLRRINFIKNLKVYFKSKNNDNQIKKSKSFLNLKETESLYSKIMNNLKYKYLYLRKYQPYLLAMKKEETMRLHCVTELRLIDTVKKIKANNLLKQKLLNKAKLKRMTTQIASMKRISSSIIKMDKKHGTNIFIMKRTFNKDFKNLLNNKTNNFIHSSPTSRYIRKNSSLITKKDNFRINSSKMTSRNKNIYQNYNLSAINKKTSRLNSSKTKTILEVKKSMYKLLPIMSNSLNTTIGKSSFLKKQLNYFQKEANMRSQNSKIKKQKIMKKYFVSYEMPSIINSLRVNKSKNNFSKNLTRFIFESKRGNVNLKVNISKREKSPLAFVEDYNKMRNRRRQNKNYEENLGFSCNSLNAEKKINKDIVLGMSFKDIKKVITH